MERIAAVVVTYNRLALLKKCLSSLVAQAQKIDCIIVVNNGSTDGTFEYLNQQSDFKIIHQENVGGAGGFHRGMKEAYEQNYDWIWIMDDDAFPEENCLQLLLENRRSPKHDLVLAPLVVEGNRVDHLHRGHIDLKRIMYPLQRETNNNIFNSTVNQVSFVSFIGMLIGRDVISKIGLPTLQYFIFHDDVEYSIRITKGGFSMFLIKEAIIFHKIRGNRSTVEILNHTDAPNDKRQSLLQMFRDKRNKYSNRSSINLLSFIGMRNWMWTIVLHKGINFDFIRLLFIDLIKGISYVLLSKSNNLLLLRLYFIVYKQGLSGKFDNSAILSLKNN